MTNPYNNPLVALASVWWPYAAASFYHGYDSSEPPKRKEPEKPSTLPPMRMGPPMNFAETWNLSVRSRSRPGILYPERP